MNLVFDVKTPIVTWDTSKTHVLMHTFPLRPVRIEDIYRWARENSSEVLVFNMVFVLPEGWRLTVHVGIQKEGFTNAQGEFLDNVSFRNCIFLPLDQWPNWSEKVVPFEDLEKAVRILPPPGAT